MELGTENKITRCPQKYNPVFVDTGFPQPAATTHVLVSGTSTWRWRSLRYPVYCEQPKLYVYMLYIFKMYRFTVHQDIHILQIPKTYFIYQSRMTNLQRLYTSDRIQLNYLYEMGYIVTLQQPIYNTARY